MGRQRLTDVMLCLMAGLVLGVGLDEAIRGPSPALGWTCLALAALLLCIAGARILASVAEVRQLARAIGRMAQPDSNVQRVETTAELLPLAASVNDLIQRLLHGTDVVSQERNKLLAIISSMVEGVIAVNAEERIVHFNAAAGRILQLADQQQGLRVWEVVRNPQVVLPLQQVLRDGQARTIEVLIPRRKQDQIIDLAAGPLRDGEGRLAGGVAVLHDVTELRHLQGMRKDFVANVSHELKTPLTAISGLVETLLSDQTTMDPAQLQHFLQRVQKQNDRMIALVQDLLTLSRIESDEHELALERQDLAALVSDIIRTYRVQAEVRGLHLQAELPQEPLWVKTDAEAVRQIVGNLVDNAIKYTPEGGSITVDLQASDSGVVCSVSDTGLGIPEEEQDRIFERFYRVDKGRSREVGGTGLGLAIVKHLTRSLGGEVKLQSQPGQGSIFVLRLPVSPVGSLNPALMVAGKNS